MTKRTAKGLHWISSAGGYPVTSSQGDGTLVRADYMTDLDDPQSVSVSSSMPRMIGVAGSTVTNTQIGPNLAALIPDYHLIREIKTWLNINHITVHNNIFYWHRIQRTVTEIQKLHIKQTSIVIYVVCTDTHTGARARTHTPAHTHWHTAQTHSVTRLLKRLDGFSCSEVILTAGYVYNLCDFIFALYSDFCAA